MDINNFSEFFSLFSRLYNEKKLIVKWQKNSLGLSTENEFEEELKKVDHEINIEDFVKQVFRILNIMRDIVVEGSSEIADENETVAIKEFLQANPDLRDTILVRCSSNVNILDSIQYEIVTKRNKKRVTEIEAYSVLVNFTTINNNTSSGMNIEHQILELSSVEIESIIEELNRALQDINSLKS